jgi:hypothetical protein
MDDMTDEQIAAEHRKFAQKFGMNPFALLDIAARYAETLQADTEMMTPANALYNDIVALQIKYKALIERFQGNLVQNQKMIQEALPIIRGG